MPSAQPTLPFEAPRPLENTKGRDALRQALACDVWGIKDPEAYAREFARDMGFDDETSAAMPQSDENPSTPQGNPGVE